MKIQGYCHYTFIPFMSELAGLNPIEDNVEGVDNKKEQRLMPLKC